MKIQAFQFNPFGELTYLVWDPATCEAAVIDPGMSNSAEQLTFDNFVSKNSLKLKYLLYTHLHIDHTFGHEHIVATYGLEAHAGEGDAQLGLHRAEQAEMFRLPIPKPKELRIDTPLTDRQQLSLGSESFEVIFVPGHSQGSVAFYFPESRFVITGDALFNGSIGRTDLPGGNHAQLIKSIQDRLLTLPASTIVYPGHGPSTTIANELRYNPFL